MSPVTPYTEKRSVSSGEMVYIGRCVTLSSWRVQYSAHSSIPKTSAPTFHLLELELMHTPSPNEGTGFAI